MKTAMYVMATMLAGCAVWHAVDGQWLSVVSSTLFTLSTAAQAYARRS